MTSMSADDVRLIEAARPSPRQALLNSALLAASQLGWGCYPVLARALQTREPKLTPAELMVSLSALSAAALAAAGATTRALSCAQKQRARAGPVSALKPKQVIFVAFFTAVMGTRASTNLASAGLAPAHWCVMISLTTPMFTAGIGSFVFRESLPAGTIPALLGNLGFSALVIFGSQRSAMDIGQTPAELALGVALQLISTVALSVYQHCVKRTKGLLSESSILVLNYGVVLLPGSVWLAVRQAQGTGDLWRTLAALGVRQWAYLITFSLVVYLGSNLAQQVAIRSLGPTIVAAVMPLRLLSSIVGGAWLLGEAVESATEVVGLLGVVLTSAAYLSYQVWARKHKVGNENQSFDSQLSAHVSASAHDAGVTEMQDSRAAVCRSDGNTGSAVHHESPASLQIAKPDQTPWV
jgi:drug/metabolite transporter (DMT)-like permease